jgi:hypothetical protein
MHIKLNGCAWLRHLFKEFAKRMHSKNGDLAPDALEFNSWQVRSGAHPATLLHMPAAAWDHCKIL